MKTSLGNVQIRHMEAPDWPAMWQILEPVIRSGETYAYPPDISEADARRVWVDATEAVFVATGEMGESAAEILGAYYLKSNQPGLGSHVCNAGYVVAESARGRGIAGAMCEHSQDEAIARGYRAMQFNLVVATNESAVRLWKKQGFRVVGTLPGAFRHARLGYIDALVMYKTLVSECS